MLFSWPLSTMSFCVWAKFWIFFCVGFFWSQYLCTHLQKSRNHNCSNIECAANKHKSHICSQVCIFLVLYLNYSYKDWCNFNLLHWMKWRCDMCCACVCLCVFEQIETPSSHQLGTNIKSNHFSAIWNNNIQSNG